MPLSQHLQFADQFAREPTSEICVDPIFGCRDANLVEPRRLALGEVLVSKLVECRTPPQRQRLGEQPGRGGGIGVLHRPPICNQLLEPSNIV